MDVVTLQKRGSVGRANVQGPVAPSDAFGTSGQQRLFIVRPAPVDAKLERRRPAVKCEDQTVFSRPLFLHAWLRHAIFALLPGPLPIANFFLIDAFGVSIVNALNNLALQPFLDVSANGAQARNPVDDIDSQIEAVN